MSESKDSTEYIDIAIYSTCMCSVVVFILHASISGDIKELAVKLHVYNTCVGHKGQWLS